MSICLRAAAQSSIPKAPIARSSLYSPTARLSLTTSASPRPSHSPSLSLGRSIGSARGRQPYERPSPPPLPERDQREFEELVRASQAPLSSPASASSPASKAEEREAELALHPDARPPVRPEFEGDVNPTTGERGGPKREPVNKWGQEGDWSYKGRVSDF